MVAAASIGVLVAAAIAVIGPVPAGAGPTIHARRVAGGLDRPVAFTFAPGGRIFYVEKTTGEVRLLNPATDRDHLFYRVGRVEGDGERGMLGVALHPSYPARPFVYVYATRRVEGRLRNQILRIRAEGGEGVRRNVIFSSPASSSPYHNGGRILFGPDGLLYAIVGDAHHEANAQDLTDNDRGKIIRITPTGAVPDANPFGDRIYAFGIRNGFGLAFDPETDDPWETDNGPACNDEVNRILRGDNYAWGPSQTCSGDAPGNTNQDGPEPRRLPRLWFVDTIGITGLAFCDGCDLNATSEGTLFFGDVNTGTIRRVDLNAARDDLRPSTLTIVYSHSDSVLSMEVAPNGSIHFSDFGGIYRLVYS
jgi:glucose/arabinose dehydrogenase